MLAAISARIDALPAGSRTALLHASVVGQTFWRDVLANVGELFDVDEALESLEARGLVQRRSESQVEGDVEFVFKHVLIRDTAYGTLPRASRRELHAATAAHLERSVPDPAELGWILAYHWREAGEPSRAIAYLLQAARRTTDALAVEETWELYTRALDLADSDDERRAIRLQRGLAMTELEDYPRAKRELAELVPVLTGPEQIEALLAQGRCAVWTEDTEETFAVATRVAELAARSENPEHLPAARGLMSIAHGMRGDAGDLKRAIEIGTQAIEAWIPGTRSQELAELYHLQADHLYWVGRYDGALELVHLEFDAAGIDPHSAEFLLRAAGMEGLVLSGLGRYEEALTAVESAISIARSMGRPANVVTNYSTGPLRDIFALGDARDRSAEIADRLGPSDFNMPWINARADVIAADLLLGELGRVESAFPTAWDDACNGHAWERWLVSGRLCSIRAELALEMKRIDEAMTWARRALDMARIGSRKKYEVIATMTLGAAMSAAGLAEDARTELRIAVAEADVLGSPLYRWQTRAALADAVRSARRCGCGGRASRGGGGDHPGGHRRAIPGARSRVRGRPAGRGDPRRGVVSSVGLMLPSRRGPHSTVSVIGTAASALDTGHATFAVSAASRNPSASSPGTSPETHRRMPVIPSPGWKSTSVRVLSVVGGCSAFVRTFETDIA